MRSFIICLLIASGWASAANAKDDKGGLPPAPNFRDLLKDYKYEPPRDKRHDKIEIPQTYEMPDIGSVEEPPSNFDKWWIGNTIYGCKLEQVAEGQRAFFLAFEPHATYWLTGDNANNITIYVPSTPHPKGAPVAQVDSWTFNLSPQSSKTFVPHNPQTRDDMLKAMQMGEVMIVKWVDGEGVRRQDRYLLKGFSQGLAEMPRQCP